MNWAWKLEITEEPRPQGARFLRPLRHCLFPKSFTISKMQLVLGLSSANLCSSILRSIWLSLICMWRQEIFTLGFWNWSAFMMKALKGCFMGCYQCWENLEQRFQKSLVSRLVVRQWWQGHIVAVWWSSSEDSEGNQRPLVAKVRVSGEFLRTLDTLVRFFQEEAEFNHDPLQNFFLQKSPAQDCCWVPMIFTQASKVWLFWTSIIKKRNYTMRIWCCTWFNAKQQLRQISRIHKRLLGTFMKHLCKNMKSQDGGNVQLELHDMDIIDLCDCGAEYEEIKGGIRHEIRSVPLAVIGDLETRFPKLDVVQDFALWIQILEITWTQGHTPWPEGVGDIVGSF